LPLLGADGLPGVRASVGRLAEDFGVPPATVTRLIDRYGSMTPEVLALGAAPLDAGVPLLTGEVAYAVTHEGALHVEDVLARRARLLITAADHGTQAAPAVAAAMGALLGWGRRRRSAEVRGYEELAEADNAALSEVASSAAAVPAG
jgi:glycerol-3-phosphate dehydrogenase